MTQEVKVPPTTADSQPRDVFLSIVTVHLNEFPRLRTTLESIAPFRQPSLEWIVIDGGSDVTAEVDREVLRLARATADVFTTGPDEGIYDAMNKGTALASGSHVLFLNAGDELHRAFDIDALRQEIEENNPGMVWGRTWDRDKSGVVYPRKQRGAHWLKYGMPVCHQGVVFRRSLLGAEPYNKSYLIAADYELLARLYTHGAAVRLVDMPMAIYDLVGASSQQARLAMAEESRIRQTYFRRPWLLEQALRWGKYLLWRFSIAFPRSRKAWRQRI